jgi:predicted nucleic acid-binding protein
VKLVLDTNAIIDFLKEKADAFDLMDLIEQNECCISVITRLELLKYPDISAEEETLILDFLRLVPIMPLTGDIERETIAISRASKLKLPDAIIGSTAIVYGAAVVTADTRFLKCAYPALHIWKPA